MKANQSSCGDSTMEHDYGIPMAVVTIKETDTEIVQHATMLNSGDAILYARSCRRFGADAKIPPFDPTAVVVTYYKDSEGKIGIPA
jgi:hypothetical protein